MAVLLVASERGEFFGILKRCRNVEKTGWRLDFAVRADLGGREVLLVANGPGAALAAQAAEAACEQTTVGAVVSTGYCGALDPTLAQAEVFVATRVHAPHVHLSYEAGVPRASGEFRSGCLVSVDRVVRTAAAKARLRSSGAAVVEMEAAGVAAAAARKRLPFFCIRAVLDRAEEGFQLDFDALKRADGRFDRTRIAGQVFIRPRVLPELLRIQRGCRLAARALGEFFEDCRFPV